LVLSRDKLSAGKEDLPQSAPRTQRGKWLSTLIMNHEARSGGIVFTVTDQKMLRLI
jgi:hypothetical protein